MPAPSSFPTKIPQEVFSRFLEQLPDIRTPEAGLVASHLIRISTNRVREVLFAYSPELSSPAIIEELANETVLIVMRVCKKHGFRSQHPGALVNYTRKTADSLARSLGDKQRRDWKAAIELGVQMDLAVDASRLTFWDLPHDLAIEDLKLVWAFLKAGGANELAKLTGTNRGTLLKQTRRALGRIRDALHGHGLDRSAFTWMLHQDRDELFAWVTTVAEE